MCLLLTAYSCHDDFQLIVAANRDEYYDRPAAPAEQWHDHCHIFGGRDLQGGGTWLAVDHYGRFAAITNVRTPQAVISPRSRGLIVNDYLTSQDNAAQYLRELALSPSAYSGFNVIASSMDGLSWYSNQFDAPRDLEPGVYGLSNASLDTPWPKVTELKRRFERARGFAQPALIDTLFDILADDEVAPDDVLPDTGVGLHSERILSPIFIDGTNYGTRCSTIVLITQSGKLLFHERRYGPGKESLGETRHEFEIRPLGT